MNIFFDTSALVKFFHEEPGTKVVTDLINNPGNNIFVSNLARLEFISALSRRYRNNEIAEQSLNEAVSGFDEEYFHFHIEPVGNMVLQEAEDLLIKYGKNYGLRTLDAIHLATFVLIKSKRMMTGFLLQATLSLSALQKLLALGYTTRQKRGSANHKQACVLGTAAD